MSPLSYRLADQSDVAGLAEIRAAEWGTVPYWEERIRGYLTGERSPGEALAARTLLVAVEGNRIVGLIAGHRTRRFGCDGELEWLDVRREARRRGIATALLFRLAGWFTGEGLRRVCVDVAPENLPARAFYTRHGAEPLRPGWLVWPDITRLVR